MAKAAKKEIPYAFVLEELAGMSPYTKPMFGCTGVYVGEAIVLILRKKEQDPENNGIWIATTGDRHAALREHLPSMRSIPLFGPGETGWQWLPEADIRFEEEAFKACELVRKKSPLIGKVPKGRKKPGKAKAKPKTRATAKRKKKR